MPRVHITDHLDLQAELIGGANYMAAEVSEPVKVPPPGIVRVTGVVLRVTRIHETCHLEIQESDNLWSWTRVASDESLPTGPEPFTCVRSGITRPFVRLRYVIFGPVADETAWRIDAWLNTAFVPA